jgi:hypothetical protein
MTRAKMTGVILGASFIALAAVSYLPEKSVKQIAGAGMSFFISPAHAVVGRPLTPVSYAGVARRTARRTARRY